MTRRADPSQRDSALTAPPPRAGPARHFAHGRHPRGSDAKNAGKSSSAGSTEVRFVLALASRSNGPQHKGDRLSLKRRPVCLWLGDRPRQSHAPEEDAMARLFGFISNRPDLGNRAIEL